MSKVPRRPLRGKSRTISQTMTNDESGGEYSTSMIANDNAELAHELNCFFAHSEILSPNAYILPPPPTYSFYWNCNQVGESKEGC